MEAPLIPPEDVITFKDSVVVSVVCVVCMLGGANIVHNIFKPDIHIPVFGDYDEDEAQRVPTGDAAAADAGAGDGPGGRHT